MALAGRQQLMDARELLNTSNGAPTAPNCKKLALPCLLEPSVLQAASAMPGPFTARENVDSLSKAKTRPLSTLAHVAPGPQAADCLAGLPLPRAHSIGKDSNTTHH